MQGINSTDYIHIQMWNFFYPMHMRGDFLSGGENHEFDTDTEHGLVRGSGI